MQTLQVHVYILTAMLYSKQNQLDSAGRCRELIDNPKTGGGVHPSISGGETNYDNRLYPQPICVKETCKWNWPIKRRLMNLI